METSAVKNIGVEQLFNRVATEIRNMMIIGKKQTLSNEIIGTDYTG
jgi:hypothetical protein